MLKDFCPDYAVEIRDERFCEGCDKIDYSTSSGCNFCSEEEKQEIFNIKERLEIGL